MVAQVIREGPEQGQVGCCKENGQEELTVRAKVAQHCPPSVSETLAGQQAERWMYYIQLGCTSRSSGNALVEALLCLFGG